jgi:hypothetical protein
MLAELNLLLDEASRTSCRTCVADGSNAVVVIRSIGLPSFQTLTVLSLSSCA